MSEKLKLWVFGFVIGLIIGLAIWGIYSLVTGKKPTPSASTTAIKDRDYTESPLEPKWYDEEKGCTQEVCNEKYPCDIIHCKSKFPTICL